MLPESVHMMALRKQYLELRPESRQIGVDDFVKQSQWFAAERSSAALGALADRGGSMVRTLFCALLRDAFGGCESTVPIFHTTH